MSVAEPALETPPASPAPRAAAVMRSRNPLARYARWLHLKWPAGTVEPLPRVNPDGTTNVPGLYIVGDLTGIPLLKFSSDTGAKAARAIARELSASKRAPGSSAVAG